MCQIGISGLVNKIKYMFPKAHAVAYVMMGIRIAWFKIHEPLAYYAAFFTIRATAFDYGLMCQGKAAIDNHIKAYKANPNLSKKEQDTLRDMRIVQEMYARGFEFMPIDIYVADDIRFQVIDGKIMLHWLPLKEWERRLQKRWRKRQKMVHICPKMILETVRKQVRRL